MKQALRVLETLMKPEIESGKIEIRHIDGMTIENRAALLQSLPECVLEQVKQCDVLLKGPMVTPRAGDPWPNLISANSMLRRSLDLYAAVRPIKIPEKGIDWTFFRENIEGEYIWGNKGIQVNEDLAEAAAYGHDPELAGQLVVFSSIFSIGTMFLLIFLLKELAFL